MDCEVPEYPAGAGDECWPRELDDDRYYFAELLELLRHGRDDGSSEAAAHGSVVDQEKPSPNLPPPTTTAPKSTVGEAEMASWLSQVFDDCDDVDAASAAARSASDTAGTSRDVDGSAATTGDANNKAECCRGVRRGGRRSCSGRAAEQRRRNKINDKMRTLQQLVPRCSKTDKASTLEEVIQYVKSLQHQLQVMMSTGYASVPTAIFPPGMAPPLLLPPPSCMQPASSSVFPAGLPAATMLPHPYPFVGPRVFACPHQSNNGMPPTLSRQFVHHSHVVPSVDGLPAAHESFFADENRRRTHN